MYLTNINRLLIGYQKTKILHYETDRKKDVADASANPVKSNKVYWKQNTTKIKETENKINNAIVMRARRQVVL